MISVIIFTYAGNINIVDIGIDVYVLTTSLPPWSKSDAGGDADILAVYSRCIILKCS